MELNKKDISNIKKKMLIEEILKWQNWDSLGLLDITKTENIFKEETPLSKQSWDMGLVFYCIKEIDKKWKHIYPEDPGTELIDCIDGLELWQKADRRNRHLRMELGDIVILNGIKQGQPTKHSQVGIVVWKDRGGEYEIVEANDRSTFDPIKKNRNGIFLNRRHTKGDQSLKILGHLTPWREL